MLHRPSSARSSPSPSPSPPLLLRQSDSSDLARDSAANIFDQVRIRVTANSSSGQKKPTSPQSSSSSLASRSARANINAVEPLAALPAASGGTAGGRPPLPRGHVRSASSSASSFSLVTQTASSSASLSTARKNRAIVAQLRTGLFMPVSTNPNAAVPARAAPTHNQFRERSIAYLPPPPQPRRSRSYDRLPVAPLATVVARPVSGPSSAAGAASPRRPLKGILKHSSSSAGLATPSASATLPATAVATAVASTAANSRESSSAEFIVLDDNDSGDDTNDMTLEEFLRAGRRWPPQTATQPSPASPPRTSSLARASSLTRQPSPAAASSRNPASPPFWDSLPAPHIPPQRQDASVRHEIYLPYMAAASNNNDDDEYRGPRQATPAQAPRSRSHSLARTPPPSMPLPPLPTLPAPGPRMLHTTAAPLPPERKEAAAAVRAAVAADPSVAAGIGVIVPGSRPSASLIFGRNRRPSAATMAVLAQSAAIGASAGRSRQ
ncbi:hypothetical protein HK405_013465 [Cladochytrium tenue]|nr:hypothetical protein HK405_013465 [Cladochytrium tenue]